MDYKEFIDRLDESVDQSIIDKNVKIIEDLLERLSSGGYVPEINALPDNLQTMLSDYEIIMNDMENLDKSDYHQDVVERNELDRQRIALWTKIVNTTKRLKTLISFDDEE